MTQIESSNGTSSVEGDLDVHSEEDSEVNCLKLSRSRDIKDMSCLVGVNYFNGPSCHSSEDVNADSLANRGVKTNGDVSSISTGNRGSGVGLLDDHHSSEISRGKGLVKSRLSLGKLSLQVNESSVHETSELSRSVASGTSSWVCVDSHVVHVVTAAVHIRVSSVESRVIGVEILKVKLVFVTDSSRARTGGGTWSKTLSWRRSRIHTGRAGVITFSTVDHNDILGNVGIEPLIRIRPSITNSRIVVRIIRVEKWVAGIRFLESTIVDIQSNGCLITDTFSCERHFLLNSVAHSFINLVANIVLNTSIRLHLVMNDRHPTNRILA